MVESTDLRVNGLWSSSIRKINVSVHMFQSNPRLCCIGKSPMKRSRLLTSLVRSSNGMVDLKQFCEA